MKNVVITGASKGIGLATAKLYASKGYKVLISSRNEDNLQLAKDSSASQIYTFSCDASAQNEIEKLTNYVLNDFGGCDILINNAGVFIPGSIYDESDSSLSKMLEVNVLSAYYLTKHLLPSLQQKKSGDIVNICSIASTTAYPNGGSYSISKAALLSFSKNLREEMKPYGIRVMSVLPGATFTDSWAGADIDEQRLMPPEDIAQLIVNATELSRRSVVEEIVVRPLLGDL